MPQLFPRYPQYIPIISQEILQISPEMSPKYPQYTPSPRPPNNPNPITSHHVPLTSNNFPLTCQKLTRPFKLNNLEHSNLNDGMDGTSEPIEYYSTARM